MRARSIGISAKLAPFSMLYSVGLNCEFMRTGKPADRAAE